MPRTKFKLPSYRLHKPSGRAVVTLNGRDVYLGTFGTPESNQNYERVLKEWLEGHRQLARHDTGQATAKSGQELSIDQVFLAYWDFVREYYRKNGSPTSEVSSIKRAVAPLLELYGLQPAGGFGPLALKTCRRRMIEAGLSRGVINKHVSRIKRFFKWATENELIPSHVHHAISAVTGLRCGRSPAPESRPVTPVSDELVNATLKHVNRYVAAMIQLQRLTGMRPCEVTIMRERDLEKNEGAWVYKPASHKTEHHDRERVIYLGPQAQETVKPFLMGDPDAFLFSPKLAVAEQNRLRRAGRKTPMTPSQRKRHPKKHPRKHPKECYTTCSYERAISYACDKAFPVPANLTATEAKQWQREHRWSPNRLRHTAATNLRKQFGIEAARVVLGHSSSAVTEIYAELDRAKAAEIMARVG